MTTLLKLTSRNAISCRHVSSCVATENHLTLFKKRHLLDENRVDGTFNPQPKKRRHISPGYKISKWVVIF